MCAKLRTVPASNNRDHPTRSLYYCLFAPHTYIFVLRARPVRGESYNQRNTTGEVATTPPECRPGLLCRYVDDLFLLLPNQDYLNRFITNINSIHRNIVFTKELENNNCLHFLDVLIEKTSTGFITSTYRKPTHTGLHSNGRVSFRCTGNETLSTLYSAVLMTLPVPTNWYTRNLWILSECSLATGTPTIFWTAAFSNS